MPNAWNSFRFFDAVKSTCLNKKTMESYPENHTLATLRTMVDQRLPGQSKL
ncbi:unnamed protein product [Arctogadus glacialis]